MKKLENLFFIILGIACDAFGVATFVLPNGFLVGGITGVGRVLNHYFSLEVSLAVGIVSVLLFILAWASLGKKFAMSIVLGTFLFPAFLNVFEHLPILQNLTDNVVIAAVFGGIMMGMGVGLIIKAGASSGGSDVIPVILNRKFNLPVAPLVYVSDFIILLLQLPFAKTEDVLLGIMLLLICTMTLNKVILTGSSDVQFTIISSRYEEINRRLQDEADVGTTLLHSKTGHLGNEIDVIVCIAAHKDVHAVKSAISDIDPEAFVTMINVNDVKGRGFTLVRKY